ncbi:hypothetical protein HW132_10340 [Brasilonema sp. CT11]|nr:hypothetical protein [Brasilonema sp. CT11]
MSNISFSRLFLNRDYIQAQGEVYKRVIEEIGKSIEKSSSLLHDLDNPQEFIAEKDWIDGIIDDECLVVEYLLGAAFVICQAYITNVVSSIFKLHKRFEKSFGIKLMTTSGNKQDICKFGVVEHPSPIELMDALANYFKHRSEWYINWEKLDKKQQRTAKVILQTGLISNVDVEPEYQHLNISLREGSYALGNPEFTNTLVFFEKLQQWHISLADAYEKELSVYDTAF